MNADLDLLKNLYSLHYVLDGSKIILLVAAAGAAQSWKPECGGVFHNDETASRQTV